MFVLSRPNLQYLGIRDKQYKRHPLYNNTATPKAWPLALFWLISVLYHLGVMMLGQVFFMQLLLYLSRHRLILGKLRLVAGASLSQAA